MAPAPAEALGGGGARGGHNLAAEAALRGVEGRERRRAVVTRGPSRDLARTDRGRPRS